MIATASAQCYLPWSRPHLDPEPISLGGEAAVLLEQKEGVRTSPWAFCHRMRWGLTCVITATGSSQAQSLTVIRKVWLCWVLGRWGDSIHEFWEVYAILFLFRLLPCVFFQPASTSSLLSHPAFFLPSMSIPCLFSALLLFLLWKNTFYFPTLIMAMPSFCCLARLSAKHPAVSQPSSYLSTLMTTPPRRAPLDSCLVSLSHPEADCPPLDWVSLKPQIRNPYKWFHVSHDFCIDLVSDGFQLYPRQNSF